MFRLNCQPSLDQSVQNTTLHSETMVLVTNVLAGCAISFHPYTMFSRPFNAQGKMQYIMYVLSCLFCLLIFEYIRQLSSHFDQTSCHQVTPNLCTFSSPGDLTGT
jgi:hypothetical protein